MKKQFNEQCITYSQMHLIFNMRILWRRLAIWSRIYILSRYLGIGTAEVSFERLYIENLDFGDVLQLHFTRSIADRFSRLMNQFSIGLRELISAELDEDFDAIRLNIDRLFQNTDETATFLASVNPFFDETALQELFTTYMQDTLQEASLFAAEDYRMDIEYFDRLMEHTSTLGDTFAEALFLYITSGADTSPPQDGQMCITSDEMNLIYDLKMFWFDLIVWVRALMLSKYLNVGDEAEVHERLQRVATDHIDNLQQFFGENPALNELQSHLTTYINLIDALVAAQIAGNVEEINQTVSLLYQNADDIAASRAALNPYTDQNELRTQLYNNLGNTIDQSTMFLTEDYARNLSIFSALMDQAESFSDAFAEDLLAYLFQVHPSAPQS